jgi:hypothetical protein
VKRDLKDCVGKYMPSELDDCIALRGQPPENPRPRGLCRRSRSDHREAGQTVKGCARGKP